MNFTWCDLCDVDWTSCVNAKAITSCPFHDHNLQNVRLIIALKRHDNVYCEILLSPEGGVLILGQGGILFGDGRGDQ